MASLQKKKFFITKNNRRILPENNTLNKKKLIINNICKNKKLNSIDTYLVKDLKHFCKKHQLKQSGNKPEIYSRVKTYIKKYKSAIILQTIFRKNLYNKLIELRGECYYDKSKCSNQDDILTLEPVAEIPNTEFFSFKENKTNTYYGFSIQSFYNLCISTLKTNGTPLLRNPYTRTTISIRVINDFKHLLKLVKIFKIPICLTVEDDKTSNKTVDERINDVFDIINQFGNYAQSEWFTGLTATQKQKFYRELYDIWIYRANLSTYARISICPPNGNPFINTTTTNTPLPTTASDEDIVTTMERFINSTSDESNRALGAMYILTALTLVSHDAAEAMPWLHATVVD
tara:strand:+ start:2387 stop:3421 length:1035 start_codon:yes stop_codon:yes gene_type:complete